MERIIKIGDKEIYMKSTAATPMHYRNQFKGRDLLKEMAGFNGDDLSSIDTSVFDRLAYIMSGAFKDGISLEDWLEQFEMMEFIEAYEDIVELWMGSNDNQNISNSKNAVAVENSAQVF